MTIESKQAIRQRFSNDIHRPRFHYLPPSNWMNDPNGVIQWNNRYHLFYQYNPDGAYHANMHWGHAVSDDLIHWEDLPVAIAPTPNSVDAGGIFSGSIVNHDGTPKMFYTGVNPDHSIQTQCLATGDDDLVSWEKYAHNPIIAAPPDSMEQIRDFRDPFVWREDDTWYMVVGSRIEGVGGAALLYRSQNLTAWEYLNPLLVGDLARNGVMWECPNFFPLGDKRVLIISSHIGYTTGKVIYFVGEYKNFRFTPEVEGILDAGFYYAPLSHLDNQNRRILYGWLREARSVEQQKSAGWSGVQAIPRILTLDSKNRLLMNPAPELEKIRQEHHQFSAGNITENPLPVSGLALDIQASFSIETNTQCGIVIAAASDGKEQTRIFYDANTETLRVQRQTAENDSDIDTKCQGVPHRLDSNETLDLRILLDGSVLEIIANERSSLTSRIYPQQTDSQHIHIENPSAVNGLDIWEMSSIW